MNTHTQFAEEVKASLPEPGTTPVEHLRHTVASMAKRPDDDMVQMATYNIYGVGVTTGLTVGDLRALLAQVDQH